ncbi:MAG: hypothetical protein OQK73_06700 [Gammaproteobacteria bacterium]|nr:hypothetical protein [Gammaproteobacteria bacterium]
MADTGNIKPLSRTWPGRLLTPSQQSDKVRNKPKHPVKEKENNSDQDRDSDSAPEIDEYA